MYRYLTSGHEWRRLIGEVPCGLCATAVPGVVYSDCEEEEEEESVTFNHNRD